MGAIIDYIVSLFEFFINIIESTIWFVTSLPQFIAILNSTFHHTPPFIHSFLLISMAATVLFAVIRLI